jgi:hypothetical protein
MWHRAYIVAVALALFGCTQSGTGVLLTIDGPGLTVDQLEVSAAYDGKTVMHQVPSTPRALTLPTSVTLALPDHATSVTLTVTARAAGATVGAGSTGAIAVAAHQVVPATVTLTAGSSPPPPPGSCGQITLLGDDFSGAAMPVPFWNINSTSGINIGESSNNLVITLASPAAGDDAGYQSRAWYDLTGSSIAVDVPQMVDTSVNGFASFNIQQDDKNDVEILQQKGYIFFAKGKTDVASMPYDPVQQRWWQLREAGGTLYYETSPDGTSWTQRAMTATPTWATTARLLLSAGSDDALSNGGAVHYGALAGGTPSGTVCAAHRLTDDFADGVRSSAWLASYQNNGLTMTETGGVLDVALQPKPASGEYISSYVYDLTGDAVLVEVPMAAQKSDGAVQWLRVGVDETADTGYEMQVDEGTLIFQRKTSINGADVRLRQPYDPTQHRWWRMREAKGALFYETSGDGKSWTSQLSEVVTYPVSAVRVHLGVSVYDAAATSPGHVSFAHVNLPPM